MIRSINPSQLIRALQDGGEFALLDVRERGQYARGHLFLAINLPLGVLELRIRQYVPCRDARVILCDDGEGFAERAAEIMSNAGYTQVFCVEGGVSACHQGGFQLFRGHYVVPYTFGLYVNEHYRTPGISPRMLKDRMDAGEPMVILDTRNNDEFRQASIPGAINVPLTELSYRIRDVAPDPETPIVINCGAVTRGVLGGQTLLEAGVENPVAVLANGVRGWSVAGFELEHDVNRSAGPVSEDSAAWAARSALRVAQPMGVRLITASELDRWRGDTSRTLYVIDVRTRQEYEDGHLPDAIWVLGGELAGLYEDHIGTLNARFCLVDDNGARAIVTASWLTRMGWPDVVVLEGGVSGHDLVTGPQVQDVVEVGQADVDFISPQLLAEQIDTAGTLILDFNDSVRYALGHIPGAWWTLRSGLPSTVGKLPSTDRLVATCPDGRLAALSAVDLQRLTHLPVSVLEGGTAAWREHGLELVTGLTRTLGELDDVSAEFAVRPFDDKVTLRAAQQRMLNWQDGLLRTLAQDATFTFPHLPTMQ